MKISRLVFIMLFVSLLVLPSYAVEVNKDGKDLINQASQAYTEDLGGRPAVTDPAFSYVEKVAQSIVPKGRGLPEGVRIKVTVIDSLIPELYSYVDGNIVITTGFIYALDNEAQLAAALSHEVAHIAEGHYIEMYQAIKARERKARWKATGGALLGAFMDTAVDYTVEVETAKQYDALMKGEETYLGTAKSMAKIGAAQGAYYGVKDVIDNIPAKDNSGVWIDPRQRFEVVADAQGMEYLARAGYDVGEADAAWRNVQKVHSQKMREKEESLGPWAAQLRETESMMQVMRHRLRESLGASGLVQTISDIPPSRADLVADFTNLKEVRDVSGGKKGVKNAKKFQNFIEKALLAKAQKAFDNEDYDGAHAEYKVLYDKGIKTPQVVYGLAKSSMGDFAFGATEGEKKKAEKLYREAASMDKKYAEPYRGLGELYEDWERYGDAVKAYSTYLRLAPRASDRGKIERKINSLKRKAAR